MSEMSISAIEPALEVYVCMCSERLSRPARPIC